MGLWRPCQDGPVCWLLVAVLVILSMVGCSTSEPGNDREVSQDPASTSPRHTLESLTGDSASSTTAAKQEPPGNGATFVVAGPFPGGSLAYLDSDGVILRYNGPPTETFAEPGRTAICPGQKAIVGMQNHRSLTTQSLTTGTIEEVDLGEALMGGYIVTMSCRDTEGKALWVVVGFPSGDNVPMELWEINEDSQRLVTEVSDQGVPTVQIIGDHVLINRHYEEGESLSSLDVKTGESELIGEVSSGSEFGLVSPHPSRPSLIGWPSTTRSTRSCRRDSNAKE